MTLEDFKDVCKDKTPLEKLNLLIVQTDFNLFDVRSLERDKMNGNEKGVDYLRSEIKAREERIQWLYDQLTPVLKAQEPLKPVRVAGRFFNYFACGACKKQLGSNEYLDAYCRYCGQAVKWK